MRQYVTLKPFVVVAILPIIINHIFNLFFFIHPRIPVFKGIMEVDQAIAAAALLPYITFETKER